ncbi:(E3-independent) E2 ubiquitin-conjugating enzyme UBE2O-like [Metopolophium dirhodum]|uniref:(E3-independent) E2 ubiquitin-conjugating enzyme UBE2O-like n=1 Tax=Metopolophium dirhodum TaxID=44670 RepID=UPI00298FEC0A|nr:(E3-independent) E2 ubiquitin-conjugating enzyme UBE2O-like [Metopolophium dirhodum]
MAKDDEKFFDKDEVATVSSNTGLVYYGLVSTTNRPRSLTVLRKTSYTNRNEIKVIWHPNGPEEIISDAKVVLMNRSLMPGDAVQKFSEGKPSQFGYCENIDINATVKILNTNKIIENINSRNFTHTKPFAINSSVFYESWVGGVDDVKSKVTFVSQDGSIFTLEDPYRGEFINLSTSDGFPIDDDAFYHGQKFKMYLSYLKNAKFLTISNLMKCLLHDYKKNFSYKFGSKLVKVYVQDVIVSSVEVEWYCQTLGGTKPREEYWPARLFTGDNLKKLKTIHLFESCSTHVGDTHWYTIKDTDHLMTMKRWRSKCTEAFNIESGTIHGKHNKDKNHNKLLGTKQPSKSLHPIELDPINIDNLLLSTQNGSCRNISAVLTQKNERILNKECKFTLPSKKCRFKPSTRTTGNSCVHTLKSNRLKRNRLWISLIKKSKQFNIPKIKTKPNSKVVVEICYTKSMVDVIWQDGTKEMGVSSTDLYPVQTLDDLEFFPGDFVTEKNPVTYVYGVVEYVDHAERTARIQWFKVYPDNPSLPNPIEKTYFSVYDLRAHPDFYFKSGCLIRHRNPDTNPDLNTLTAGQVLSAGPDGRILVMWVNGEKTECWPHELFVVKPNSDGFSFQDEEYDLSEDWMSECGFITSDTEPVYEVTKPKYNQSITKPEEAGVFGVVETLMDNSHKYINYNDNLNPSLPKVIAKDIHILQKSLPAGIWVKTFENRLDLFSIMIRGPEETPYAGGLFLFDVKILPTYPSQPPLFHYYSYCYDRLNPNLHEDGRVCLSLLDTWSGHGFELWSPDDSNLLQLLLSIQGVILVSEPYYNEPGFDSQRGQKLAKENSRVYNEMVLIKVVQSMTNMLNMNNSDIKNAGYFEEEILEHLKTHGPKLISAFENWIQMSEKELTEDEKLVPGYPLLPLSKGFCLSIIKALKDFKEVLITMNIVNNV